MTSAVSRARYVHAVYMYPQMTSTEAARPSRMRNACCVWLVLVTTGCAAPQRQPSGKIVYCGSIHEGSPCGDAGASCISGLCGNLGECACDGTAYHCEMRTPAAPGASCADVSQGTMCQIEGYAACNQDPVSGGCTCGAAGWQCFSSCPEGCPRERPPAGTACSIPADRQCRYIDPPYGPTAVTCTCTSGTFSCA